MDVEEQTGSLCSASDTGTVLTDFDSVWSDSDFESDDEDNTWPKVQCLSSFAHLERLAGKAKVKLTKETNRRLLYLTLQKIGPITAQKLIKKLVQKGGLDWGEEEDEVEAILDYGKDEESRDLYLIKWKGWTNEHNTWEPVHHINCPELIEEFHKLNKEAELENPNSGTFKTARRPLKWGPANPRPSSAQITELLDRLERVQGNITPLQLLRLHDPNKLNKGRVKEVMYGGGRAKKRTQIRSKNITNKRTQAYKKLKAEVQLAIKRWEDHMNSICTDPASIRVENTFDLEGPPGNFTYINDYKEGPGVKIPQDPIIGCECTDCYDERKSCCGHNAGSQFAYYKTGKLRLPPGYPIYECNKHCKCPSTCINRVVQHGRKYRVCIFRTHNNCGWGVKTLQRIKKGSFVMEYVGEVISSEEAERRGKIYDANRHTYLFDLDYNDDDNPFTVDAAFYGNVSHFINHSCDPNLTVYGVWINTLDPGLPRIAFFANRDIAKGEELTFDYLYSGNRNKMEAAEDQAGDMQLETPISENQAMPQEGNPVIVNGDATTETNSITTLPPVPDTDAVEAMDVEPETGEKIMDSETTLTPASAVTHINGEINGSETKDDMPPSIADEAKGDAVPMDTEMGPPATAETVRSPVRSSFGGSPKNAATPTTNGLAMQSPKSGPSPTPSKIKFRMMCQCGAKNCRKYLF